MQTATTTPVAKRSRYELLPQRRGGGDAGRASASPPLDDISEGVEATLFEGAVVQRYSELVAQMAQEANGPAVPTIAEMNARYRRLVKVGEGSFGEVYIVYDTVSGTYLTMKRMLKLLHKGTARSLFGLHNTNFRELQLLTTLRHPNIIDVVDHHIMADGSLLMFMPVVTHDFSTLARHWGRVAPPHDGSPRATRMPLPVIKCLFRQLLEGMAYLHRHKVIHRDLKPSNLMVGADGLLKIMDFGWARYMAADRGGRMTGPPCVVAYRAPEVLVGGPGAMRYTFAVDMWCCGCILFEMLSGGEPFISTRHEAQALSGIIDWLGSPLPTSSVYTGKRGRVAELPLGRPSNFRARCTAHHIAPADVDFIARMLTLEPGARARAETLLLDDWFTTPPAACRPPEIPLPPANTYRFLENRRAKRH